MSNVMRCAIWYLLHNLKNLNNNHGGVKYQAQPATLLKIRLLHECFSSFLNCADGTKARKLSQMICKIFAELKKVIKVNVNNNRDIFKTLSNIYDGPLAKITSSIFALLLT